MFEGDILIVVHLTGGLGNQLFQYAFARSLSYTLGVELFLDVSLFSHNERRKHVVFGLHSFNIKGLVGYYPYVDKTSVGMDFNEPHILTKYVEGIPFPDNIHDYNLIDNFEDIRLPAYFRGWYQNQIHNRKNSYITENYFKINNDLIHDDLKYSLPLSDNSKRLFEDIQEHDSIALHIRHGDYEDYPKFGLCTVEYYQNAISLIAEELDNPKFYIFTEDPDWVDANLEIDFPYQVIRFNVMNNTVGRGYAELLKLMSLCEHFIIANSTFSWWAAWLCENKNKIIISPKPWFQDRTILQTDTIDNVKTINLKNDYSTIYDNSERLLYEMNGENHLNSESELFLKNIVPKNPGSRTIIKFSLESNCFNGLRIYYKTETDNEYLERNSLNLYYYEGEVLDHCLILPDDAVLDEIMIKPYILKHDENEFMKINSIGIKELVD